MKIYILISAIFFSAAITFAAPGDLDPTFSGDGELVVSGSSGNCFWLHSLAIQPDEKIVVGYNKSVGASGCYFVVARLNSDGSPDTTFGNDGEINDFVLDGNNNNGTDIAIQSDGKILTAATWDYAPITVKRHWPDGSPDATFGSNGTISIPVGSYSVSLATQSDGKILAVADFYLIRLNSNGSLDATFGGGDGVANVPPVLYGWSGAIQSDGKIVVTGASRAPNHGFAAARFNADGSLDTSFDGDGYTITPVGQGGAASRSVAIQSDGKIVVAGGSSDGSNQDFALVRYNADGSLDTSFDSDGKVTTPLGADYDEALSIVIEASGEILAAGYKGYPSNSDFALVRYNPNGSLDRTFGGGDGISTLDFENNSNDLAGRMAVDSEGRAVVVGESNGAFAVARFVLDNFGDPTAPFDFDGDGKTDISVFRPSDGNWYVINSGASPPTYLIANWGIATDIPMPADYDGDGKTDIAVYRENTGEWFIVRSSDNSVSVVNYPIGYPVVPFAEDFDGDAKADPSYYEYEDGIWHIHGSKDGDYAVNWGYGANLAVPGNYDSDDKTDIAVWGPNGRWSVLRSSDGGYYTATWGIFGDIPVPADYDGDGKDDIAVYRPSDGTWYVIRSGSNGTQFDIVSWGISTDIPVSGDYDGDGHADIAQFRPSTGEWFVLQSTSGFLVTNWGTVGDKPTPSAP